MRQILVDTSALYALADARDPDHQAVANFVRELQGATLLITDYILDETLTLIKSRFGSQPAITTGEKLRESAFCTLIHLDAEDEARTWQIFSQYADKPWSYTNCSSLAIMRKLSITEVLALDHHFDQMGMTRLPP
jgi:hypothetical protein